MFRKRGGRGGGRGGSNRFGGQQTPRGTFENGAWLCDCDPKLPAEHFRVKKEGPNKGRWCMLHIPHRRSSTEVALTASTPVYTCQQQQDQRCGFFLWDEDAEPRMQAAVLNGASAAQVGRSAASEGRAPPQAARQTPPPPYSVMIEQQPTATQGPTSHKRPRSAVEEDDSETESETLSWPPTVDDRRDDPAQRTISQARISPPSTPRKVQKTDATATAGGLLRADRPAEHGLVTPHTTSKREASRSAAAPETPTPARHHDALGTSPTKLAEDIASTVFSYLAATQTQLKPDTAVGLRSILDTHSQQVRGFTKGRDIAREAIKTRDAKVSELVKRVETLEADLEVYRARVRSMREDKG